MSQPSSLFLVTTALLSSPNLTAQEPWQPGPPLFAAERVHAAATVRGGTLYALGGTPWLNGADQDGSVHSLLPGGAAWVEEIGLEGMGSVIGQGTGFCRLELAPSPKSHSQELGTPLDKSWKVTASGERPEFGCAERLAVGASLAEYRRERRRLIRPYP